MKNGKPIIGLAGGIGSGKSFVAGLFGELGCQVIRSDELVHAAYSENSVKIAVGEMMGQLVFSQDGSINRDAVAKHIFGNSMVRSQLERLLHPIVEARRKALMQQGELDSQVLAFVWDTPLLFETGLYQRCDALVFVEASRQDRLRRLMQNRGWDEAELLQRENSQWPLDKKRELSQYIIVNTTDADSLRSQVRDVLSRTLANQ